METQASTAILPERGFGLELMAEVMSVEKFESKEMQQSTTSRLAPTA